MADSGDLARGVRAALQRVINPRTGVDVISGEQVRNIEVDDEGKVHLQFVLGSDDPGSLVKEVRAAAEGVPGAARVKIDVRLPNAPQPQRPRQKQPGSVPAPTPDPKLVVDIKNTIAVSSGKGGVGKSTIAANLAAGLAEQGYRVGLLDADVYGPDIPLMFGEKRKPRVTGAKGQEKIVPLEAHGVQLMSLGFLLEDEQPAIMRGPLVSGILRQFLEQVEWGQLDYLIVDMPPGTGDAQLTLTQRAPLAGAVIVTTPQEVSLVDARKGLRMFEQVKVPVLGIVENMAFFACDGCGKEHDLFRRGGGRRTAETLGVPFLGEVPLEPAVVVAGDEGVPIVRSEERR